MNILVVVGIKFFLLNFGFVLFDDKIVVFDDGLLLVDLLGFVFIEGNGGYIFVENFE